MRFAKNRLRAALLVCAAAALIAPTLRAQIPPSKPEPAPPRLEPYRDRIPHGFYLSAQATSYWHASYPGGYYLETDWPTDLQYAVVLLDSIQFAPGKTVPGIAFGYATGEDIYFGTVEISYSQASFANQPETFTGIFHLADRVDTTTLNFTQSARKISILDASARLGVFPFRKLGLAIYVTGGVGYLTFSYQSPASAYVAAQGYNLDYLKQGYLKDLSIADPGSDQGNGAWSRSQIGFELGGGLEWFFGKRLSARIDYRFVTGSVKKKEFINGAIPVEADVRINYTFVNRFVAALTYYF
jgi:opacity protein-like surface antigen